MRNRFPTFETVDEISEEAENSSDNEEESSAFLDFLDDISDTVSGLGASAKNAVSTFVDAIAVLIITTCVVPIAVIFFLSG